MQRSHKIRLEPNSTQLTALKQAAGTARYAYNWALATWKQQYEDYKDGKAERPDVYSICRRWTQERPDWSRDIARCLQTRAIMNLGKAMISFWRGTSQFPTFKKKSDKGAFYISNDRSYVEGNRVRLTGIGMVKLRELPRFKGKHLGYTISCCAGKWFVSISVELDSPSPVTTSTSVVGVDVGIRNIAVASDGTVLGNPRYLKQQQTRLRHYQKQLSRQVNGSNRRQVTKSRIANIHQSIVNQRTDAVHKFTHALAKNHGTAVIETLDIESMKNPDRIWMNRALQDTCMKEVHRQLEYKMRVEKAPKYFKSSRTCSACGSVKDALPLNVRVFMCDCGARIDRDLNAALNLRNRCWVTASSGVEGPKVPAKRRAKKSRIAV